MDIIQVHLSDIDSFTMHFSVDEIIEFKSKEQIQQVINNLNGTLVIEDNQKHNPIIVIDKDFYNNFRIDLFLSEKMKRKVL